jgi:PHS family inorganic phosphate transporter-like MFS transporter
MLFSENSLCHRTDAYLGFTRYDIFAISIAATMLGYLYGSAGGTAKRHLSPTHDLTLKIATPAGTLVGQLVFGWLADIVGRKRMCEYISAYHANGDLIQWTDGYELIIITVAAFSQALAGHAEGLDIINVLAFWRFVMGVGIGGDYPLSAVIASEFSSTRSRGRVMSAVFAFQGWGTFCTCLCPLVLSCSHSSQWPL